MHRNSSALLVRLIVFSLVAAAQLPAAGLAADALALFENEIRPVLVDRCFKCHGDKKQEAGLRLSSAPFLKQGGDSGAAVVPGKPQESLLLDALRYDGDIQMPPNGKLDDRQIAAFEQWIKLGAPWPEGMTLGDGGPKLRGGPITDEERAHWAYQPITNPSPPEVSDSAAVVRNDIDRFVLAKLVESGLPVAAPASKRTLIRRATFDLTGLPPTPEEIDAFLADDSPEAFAKVVDRLLESRAYGERWGRHWLDVVRYADTAGETGDYPTPLSYKYRNWVVDAFNADLPYDQFVREQIAGDILAQQISGIADDEYKRMITATGFIAISRRFGFDVENYHHLTIQDTIDTLGQSVLGLTLGCARCHDHKYDPVNVDDYYAWYGIFESTRYSFPGSEQKKRSYDSFPALPAAKAEKLKADFDATLAKTTARIGQLEEERRQIAARLAAEGAAGFKGFERQSLKQPPAEPFGILGEVTVSSKAQSPYGNVFPPGTRGLAMPGTPNNDAFGHPINPTHTPLLTPRLHYNIDFRHVTAAEDAGGAYRFYVGRGPGNSAAVEMAASATQFLIKNGSAYEKVCDLKLGKWYNLQVTLDLRARKFSGTIGEPGKLVAFNDKDFTVGWDGTIDRTFVDMYGPSGGVTPARHIDNLAVSTSPFLPPGESINDHATRQAQARWQSYIEGRRLTRPAKNRDGHTGFDVWHDDPLPVVGVNTSSDVLEVPGTVKPGKLVVHPAEKDGVAIAWHSPLSGKVRFHGEVRDAHVCGDSVVWHVDQLTSSGLKPVASGESTMGGFQAIAAQEVEVHTGEYLQLVLLPKTHYGCDLTQIEFTIEEVDGGRRWNLVDDVVGDFLAGNPQADSHGNAGTWTFFRTPPDRGEAFGKSLSAPVVGHDLVALRQRSDEMSVEMERLAAQRDEMQAAGPYEVIYGAIEQDEPQDAQIRIRGDRRKLGDVVPRKNLEILGNDTLPDSAGSGRLALAHWMTRDENTLTARVMANRIWQWHFGEGLVATENDFGARGELPTHPKLLDWLATRFKESGWSVKAMHRLIMNSAAYQRSSDFIAEATGVDPTARLLWRFNRRRLSAEELRDSMLFISGELDHTVGGEHPFPAETTWGFSQHAPFYAVYPTKQRSIYLMQQRLKRHPFLALFDGADPNVATADRMLTTTPTQALYLMNNPFVHDCSESLASQLIDTHASDDIRIQSAYRATVGRDPSADEVTAATRFLNTYRQRIPADAPAAMREHKSLAAFVRTLFVRNEFLFVD